MTKQTRTPDQAADTVLAAIKSRQTAQPQFALATQTGWNGTNGTFVRFDGESTASLKGYRRLSSSGVINNGDRLLMARIGTTWVVLGVVVI